MPGPLVQPTIASRDVRPYPARHFRLIFATVVALTVLALILNVFLSIAGGDSEQVRTAVETCSTTYKMGFGAIVALLGSRSP